MISRYKIRVLLIPLLGLLAACGSDAGGGGGGGSSGGGNGSTWTSGVFLPSSQFDNLCAAPRAGTSDRQGTVADQNRWLRSWTNELYLWYSEVPDLNPNNFSTEDYFDRLKTPAIITTPRRLSSVRRIQPVVLASPAPTLLCFRCNSHTWRGGSGSRAALRPPRAAYPASTPHSSRNAAIAGSSAPPSLR